MAVPGTRCPKSRKGFSTPSPFLRVPGRSSDSRIVRPHAPSRPRGQWHALRAPSPVTAAGPSPNRTGFPFHLRTSENLRTPALSGSAVELSIKYPTPREQARLCLRWIKVNKKRRGVLTRTASAWRIVGVGGWLASRPGLFTDLIFHPAMSSTEQECGGGDIRDLSASPVAHPDALSASNIPKEVTS